MNHGESLKFNITLFDYLAYGKPQYGNYIYYGKNLSLQTKCKFAAYRDNSGNTVALRISSFSSSSATYTRTIDWTRKFPMNLNPPPLTLAVPHPRAYFPLLQSRHNEASSTSWPVTLVSVHDMEKITVAFAHSLLCR
jgi:hypothetical protein